MSKNGLFINGKWCTGRGDAMQSYSPIDEKLVWQNNEASFEQVEGAVSSARGAFAVWSQTTFSDRVEILEKFSQSLRDNSDKLANLIATEVGKTLWDAKGEVAAAAGKVAISIKAYNERTGHAEAEADGLRSKLEHRPHGVMCVFGPYNFPLHLSNGHIVPALLAGNTIVYKPSELSPMVAEYVVGLWQDAGLPKGVINLVQGSAKVGQALINIEDINGVLFTGSVPTGKAIANILASRLNVISALELGGNNPLIIGEVANHEASALVTIQSAFISSGQRCTCARRLLVPQGKNGDEFLKTLVAVMERIEVGNPLEEPQPFMGPLINNKAAGHVLAVQQTLLADGAVSLKPAEQLKLGPAYISPGLIDVTNVKNRADEECFGPLLQVIRTDNLAQAIKEANNTRFGLAAGLLSDNHEEYIQFKNAARAGIVNWNKPLTGASSAAPFGGVGDSGNHRASAYYAADYCSYPVASLEDAKDQLTAQPLPQGILP